MNLQDRTQHQSDQDLVRSRALSLKSAQPPAKVPGFTIEQFLGAGAYGEVWSGTETKTGRRVAIKFYTRRTSNDVEMLAREVEKLVALSADRYVVQLVTVDWEADPPYFVMDYFDQGSLEDLLKREKTLPPAMAEELFREIATGMMHLHGKGIFHCDLKPANVLLDQDGKPRLADFGQSRLGSEKSASLGTLFYMAPEQADLSAVPAAKWDVYALGSMLYCMIVGKPPYVNQALTERIESSTRVEDRLNEYRKALREAAPPVDHRKVPGVDRMLADIIDRAVDVNPNRRFDSVQEIMFALRQRELTKARKPLLILGLLGPLLLLAVMSLFSWIAWRQAYAETQRAIIEEAVEGNKFAAKLAARSAAEKIDQYVRIVEELSRDRDFINDFIRAISDPDLAAIAQQLDDPNTNADPAFDELRLEYVENETRNLLQKHLQKRMDDPFNPNCASWFVNDLRGNQLASVYRLEPDTNTIGRNYSYRTYFHGGKLDRKPANGEAAIFEAEPWGSKRKIIDRPHMSAVFKSRGTSTWKVAFSVPIREQKVEQGEEIIGLVACTVEMGDFVDFENLRSQYAMLLDGRQAPDDGSSDGPGRDRVENNSQNSSKGVILEHPLFNQLIADSNEVHKIDFDPKAIVDSQPTEPQSHLFKDPMALLPQGEAYAGDWIAAIEPVLSLRKAPSDLNGKEHQQDAESGLFVLVAEDYEVVIKPVEQLRTRLIRLAICAAIFFLVVAFAMWLLVFRMLRDSNRRLIRSFSTSADSSVPGNTDSAKS